MNKRKGFFFLLHLSLFVLFCVKQNRLQKTSAFISFFIAEGGSKRRRRLSAALFHLTEDLFRRVGDLSFSGAVAAVGLGSDAPAAPDLLDEQPQPLALLLGERRGDLSEELLLDLAIGQAPGAAGGDALGERWRWKMCK